MNRDQLRDPAAASAAVLLVAAAVLVGRHIEGADHTLFVNWPPLLASWGPHVGPGTPAALATAIVVAGYGPAVAARLSWRALLGASCATALVWTWSLALVDGWQRGVAHRLASRYEYLQAVDRFHDVPAALRDFTHHILLGSPAPWPAHVAGHPPASTLTFVLLDRVGLGGGGWAGVWCIGAGATTCVAVLVTVGRLASRETARRAAPFLALAPSAVWAGTSADGYFAAVAAWSVALWACATTGRRPRTAAFGAGLLFGLTCYLSYGLALIALIGAGTLLLQRPRGRDLLRLSVPLLCGTAVVPVLFGVAGFNWWDAYRLLVTRYDQGVGGVRPFGYWVWANLACTVLCAGLATAPALVRAGRALLARRVPGGGRFAPGPTEQGPAGGRSDGRAAARPGPALEPVGHTAAAVEGAAATPPGTAGRPDAGACALLPAPVATARTAERGNSSAEARLAVLVLCALLALLAADLSGMSKAETERIWLPFVAWLTPACALLPRPRLWLTVQAVGALLVNHVLLTGW
ncbi:hypothetical protein ACIQU5_32470 [Streptomyces sp. NPDC090306]|uniref:hypothetical protein n=1 Tax=Streptomyces sp. NPDC090306 TaxID=3365961 RepID=UPI003819844F